MCFHLTGRKITRFHQFIDCSGFWERQLEIQTFQNGYTLEDERLEPTAITHLERKMIFQTSMMMFLMLIFQGVVIFVFPHIHQVDTSDTSSKDARCETTGEFNTVDGRNPAITS